MIAAGGPGRRERPTGLGGELRLPDGFRGPRVVMPGVVAGSGPKYVREPLATRRLAASLSETGGLGVFPLIVVVDDAGFTAGSLRNFLWVVFTRSNPASDIEGVRAFTDEKHWGCHGPLVIDARIKPRHAPPLVDDPKVEKRVDALGARGGPLHGII